MLEMVTMASCSGVATPKLNTMLQKPMTRMTREACFSVITVAMRMKKRPSPKE